MWNFYDPVIDKIKFDVQIIILHNIVQILFLLHKAVTRLLIHRKLIQKKNLKIFCLIIFMKLLLYIIYN